VHVGATKFAELVDAKTQGSVKIRLFPNSTIGNDRDMAEGLQMGSVDFALIAGVLGNFEPSLQIMEMPYLFSNEEHLRKVIDGPVGEVLLDKLLKSSSIRGLSFWERVSPPDH
jgi:TRAP-type C4-dicarboxylate transport system substrate-binding protein